jgi:hypothetical protein
VALSGRTAALALLTAGIIAGLAVPLAACGQLSIPAPIASALRFTYVIGHVVCHQRPDRSFFTCGRQWPVCGRCAGLYMGFALGGLAGLVSLGRGASTAALDRTRWWRRALVVAAVPTAALWALEFVAGVNPGSMVRWAGALPLGVTTALWLAAVGRGDLR